MRNIKIFVDCHVFDGPFQGLTSYIKGLYSELIQHKNITFYLASDNPNNLEQLFGKHENVNYIKYRYKNKVIRLLYDIPYFISKLKIDFAHFQYTVSPFKKCKYIVTLHDVMFLDFPEYFPKSYILRCKYLFKWSAKKSEVVLTVSDYSKNKIQKHFNIDKLFVTRNAVDPIYFDEYQKSDAQDYVKLNFGIENFFLFVSRFEPRKNHISLLKVFVENKFYLKNELVFIGNEAHECKEFDNYYNNLTLEIKSKIKVLKRVNLNDLLEFTRAADISIFPSIAEGFGIPPLESIATETPTICSNTTAMSDFDFISEFQFNPLDEKEMVEKIYKALDYKDWKETKKQMLLKYNWKNSADEFIKAIENSFMVK
jgi:glycosyltransferase involved in cell wall biosynthesis